jgi:hypothetical protein
MPALYATRKDLARGNLTEDEGHFIVQATRELVENLGVSQLLLSTTEAVPEFEPSGRPLPKIVIAGCPAHDEADAVGLLMLQHLLDPMRYEVKLLDVTLLASEVVSLLEQNQVGLLCLGALAPGGMAHTRYLCKRLRTQLPDLKIVVGRWGEAALSDESRELLRAAGANDVGTTLRETCGQIMQWGGLISRRPPEYHESGSR